MTTATATLKRTALYGTDLGTGMTFTGQAIEAREDGTYLVRGKEIFRAGTFRDSMGDQSTWTIQHLEMMAANFRVLRDSGIFPDVPVRKDHSWTIEKVMGYIENLYVEGDRLLADFVVTESINATRLQRGTFRSVSSEVGMYVDNADTPYWPVVMGFAYVDIPAVEGLHSKQEAPVAYFSRTTEQENPVTTDNDKGAQRPTMTSFRINGADTQDHAAVQAHIATLEEKIAAFKPATFRVAGADVADVAAVQAHIDTLEGFAKDTKEGGRKSFVKGLATGNKIAAPMVENFEALVVTMTDDQFEAFKKSYEAAPAIPLLAMHGQNANTENGNGNGESFGEKAILEAQVQMHRDAGLSEDEIKNTKAYARLQTLTAGKS